MAKIRITFRQLRGDALTSALKKLGRNPHLDVATAYKLSRLSYHVRREHEIIRPLYMAIVDKYAMKDEKGQYVPLESSGQKIPDTFQVAPENQEAWDKEREEFLDTEAQFSGKLIPLSSLTKAQLSPYDIEALTPFLKFDIEEEDDEEEEPATSEPAPAQTPSSSPTEQLSEAAQES